MGLEDWLTSSRLGPPSVPLRPPIGKFFSKLVDLEGELTKVKSVCDAVWQRLESLGEQSTSRRSTHTLHLTKYTLAL